MNVFVSKCSNAFGTIVKLRAVFRSSIQYVKCGVLVVNSNVFAQNNFKKLFSVCHELVLYTL